jgi:hypothetical protein
MAAAQMPTPSFGAEEHPSEALHAMAAAVRGDVEGRAGTQFAMFEPVSAAHELGGGRACRVHACARLTARAL